MRSYIHEGRYFICLYSGGAIQSAIAQPFPMGREAGCHNQCNTKFRVAPSRGGRSELETIPSRSTRGDAMLLGLSQVGLRRRNLIG